MGIRLGMQRASLPQPLRIHGERASGTNLQSERLLHFAQLVRLCLPCLQREMWCFWERARQPWLACSRAKTAWLAAASCRCAFSGCWVHLGLLPLCVCMHAEEPLWVHCLAA